MPSILLLSHLLQSSQNKLPELYFDHPVLCITCTNYNIAHHHPILRCFWRLCTSWSTLLNCCRCAVQSILTGYITAHTRNPNAEEQKRLQNVVDIAVSIIHIDLLTIEGIYRKCCLRMVANFTIDPHHLIMPSSCCYHWE